MVVIAFGSGTTESRTASKSPLNSKKRPGRRSPSDAARRLFQIAANDLSLVDQVVSISSRRKPQPKIRHHPGLKKATSKWVEDLLGSMGFDEMSHGDVLSNPLDRTQAKKLLARFFALYAQGKGDIIMTHHFKRRCVERDVSTNDAINVMKAGSINKQGEPDIKTGEIVYNVETAKMEVSFQFLSESRIRLITVKRKR